MFFADRVFRVQTSSIIAMNAKSKKMIAQGIDVLDQLCIGEPDLPTPMNIKQAGIDAILNNKTKYTLMNGIVPLREAICNKINKSIGSDYNVDNVIVSPGAKYSIFNGFMATINEGDEVIIPAPYWVSYSDIIGFFGGKPVIVQTDPDNNFKITPKQLKEHITAKTKWFMLNSPSNPTGSIYTKQELKELADVLLEHKIWLMTDDIYEHLAFDGKTVINMIGAEPKMKNQTLIVNGFSKAYCMTGWRIGYAVGPAELIANMSKIQSQATSSICHISQEAALFALTREDQSSIVEMVELYQKRRDIAFELLSKIKGLTVRLPDGAFYMFIGIENLLGKKYDDKVINNDEDFANYILEKYLVTLVHGSAFGTKNHFRISFATTEEILKKAIKRIEDGVNNLRD